MIKHLNELEKILLKYQISPKDVCLITSSCLAANKIRDNQDLEFTLRKSARKQLLERYMNELDMNKYSGAIKFSEDIECDINDYIMFGIDDDQLFDDANSIEYGAFRVIKVEIYICQKILQNREKDMKDINLLREKGLWTNEFNEQVNKYLLMAKKNGWCMPEKDRQKLWENIFSSEKEIFIFGTGYIGRRVFNKVKAENLKDKLTGFLVSKRKDNERVLFNKKIYELEEVDKKESIVLVSVKYNDMKEDMEMLKDNGFVNLIQGFQFWIEDLSE